MVRFGTSPVAQTSSAGSDTLERTSEVLNHPSPVSPSVRNIGKPQSVAPLGRGGTNYGPMSSSSYGIPPDEQMLMDQLLKDTLSRMSAEGKYTGVPSDTNNATGLAPRPPSSGEPRISPSYRRPYTGEGTTQPHLAPPISLRNTQKPPTDVNQSPRSSSEDIQRRRRQLLMDTSSEYQSGPSTDDGIEALRRDALNRLNMQKKSTLKHFDESNIKSEQRKVTFNLEPQIQTPSPDQFAYPEMIPDPEDIALRPGSSAGGRPSSAKGSRPSSAMGSIHRGSDIKKTGSRPSSASSVRSAPETSTSSRLTEKKSISKRPSSAGRLGTRSRSRIEELSKRTANNKSVMIHNHQRYHGETLLSRNSDRILIPSDSNTFNDGVATITNGVIKRSLIHNVNLATKSQQQRKNVLVGSSLEQMENKGLRFQSMSCHDWSCNCKHPATVTRYDVKEGQVAQESLGPITCNKEYILPKTLLSTSGTSSGHMHRDMTDVLQVHSERDKNQIKMNDPKLTKAAIKKKELKKMEIYLANKPVSMKGGFRVSGPHWISRTHTQQWPWKGTIRVTLNDNCKIDTSRCRQLIAS